MAPCPTTVLGVPFVKGAETTLQQDRATRHSPPAADSESPMPRCVYKAKPTAAITREDGHLGLLFRSQPARTAPGERAFERHCHSARWQVP